MREGPSGSTVMLVEMIMTVVKKKIRYTHNDLMATMMKVTMKGKLKMNIVMVVLLRMMMVILMIVKIMMIDNCCWYHSDNGCAFDIFGSPF